MTTLPGVWPGAASNHNPSSSAKSSPTSCDWPVRTTGNTPGNVVIHARSGDANAVFLGDVLHHPLQLFKPEWSTFACSDRELSRRTRTRLVEEHAERGTRLLPAHFPSPTWGRIRRHNGAYRYDFEA